MRHSRGGLARLRLWWFARQGLTVKAAPKAIHACVRQIGWLATSSSTGIYLSIRARLPGVSREAIDRAAIDGTHVIEVPGGHGRPNIVTPREEMPLALRLHLESYEKHLKSLFADGRLGEPAVKALTAQVCRALEERPLSVTEVRGLVTHPDADDLLVVALNLLTLRGVVRRYPAEGRLDGSKYMYELRHQDDRPDLEAEGDSASIATKATGIFLRRHGPATVDEITSWSEMPKRAIRTALSALRAEAVSISRWTDEAWLLAHDAPRRRARGCVGVRSGETTRGHAAVGSRPSAPPGRQPGRRANW